MPLNEEESQRWLAFENLLMWAEAVVQQRDRLDAARAQLLRPPDLSPSAAEHLAAARARRRAMHSFNAQRHLFINAAYQLVSYRRWVGRLGIVSNDAFREIDSFEADVDILRDKNEHAIEYFRGRGKKPANWTHVDSGGTADASSTVDNRLGGRLDYVAFSEAAVRLCATLYQIDPNTKSAGMRA